VVWKVVVVVVVVVAATLICAVVVLAASLPLSDVWSDSRTADPVVQLREEHRCLRADFENVVDDPCWHDAVVQALKPKRLLGTHLTVQQRLNNDPATNQSTVIRK